MDILRIYLIIHVAAVLKTGANIEILTERNAVECGTKYTLTCKIVKYSSIVTWMFEDNPIPIAICLRNSCSLHHEYMERYQFTHDEDQGIYNLTIINVTKTDIGGKYMCSNGYERVSKILSFNVTDYKPLLFEDTENEVITASSDCVFPTINVLIKWIMIDVIDNQESALNPQLLYTNAKLCSKASMCNTNQQIQHLLVISAKPSINGKHFLKITVTYENKTIESNISTLKYNFEEKDVNSFKRSDVRKIDKMVYIVLIVTSAVVALLLVLTCCCFLKKRVRKESSVGLSCMRRCRDMFTNRNRKEENCDEIEEYTKPYVQTDVGINTSLYPVDSEETGEPFISSMSRQEEELRGFEEKEVLDPRNLMFIPGNAFRPT